MHDLSERRAVSWQACDALAAAGDKPSIGKVREWTIAQLGRKRGSDSDVQADINAWYAALLKLRHDSTTLPGLPDPVASAARDLWRLANQAAQQNLEQERTALAAEKQQSQEQLEQAKTDTAAAQETINTLQAKLNVANESIKWLEESLTTSRLKEVAKDERMAGLQADLLRKSEEQMRSVTELESFRKHALLQIDEARSEGRHWRGEAERLTLENRTAIENYRTRMSQAEALAAEAKGRMGRMQEELTICQEQITQFREQSKMVLPVSARKQATRQKRTRVRKQVK